MKEKPNGWLNIVIMLFGMFIGLAIALFVLIAWFEKVFADEPTEVTYEVEPVPFEEMIEADLDKKYEEWIEEDYTLEVVEEVSSDDIDLIARVVMSEASIESYEVKLAVAQTVVNRWRDTENEWKNVNDLYTIVNLGFSTQDNGEPTEECYEAVRQVLEQDVFPSDMLWFRLDYVKYGYEYTVDLNSRTKFSTVKRYQ